ncbi:FtsW/RodA/SpoVE family cell cycle protein [Carnobacterium viridans]|uniref:Rod shape determining protein RodA n=1 Tax=Carnobacterium viridans TaxID=174587 RepID=A0A1H1AT72_9LACT|nr:FtsW/RodA/SpoVE family cell cycle protein [Carnobacterium viridans]UDE96067.1 FtsW/RodA/SpoVE family cell cycle protein [Carnobacterium viridans]SDQ42859.1 rod shape determining protein RodA [Carnobacterium viridans]
MTENKETKIDYGIILSVLLLAIISIATIYSTTHLTANSGIGATVMQIIWYVVGAVAIVVIMQFDSEQLWKLAPIAYGFGLFLLVLVLFFYDRPTELSTGAKSWFKIGPLTFQPSEIMKIAFILMLARVVTKHNGDYPTHYPKADFLLIGKIILTSIPPLVLVMLQNDLGSTLVFIAIIIGLMLISGVTWKIILPLFSGVAALGGTLLVLVVYNRDFLLRLGFKPYQFSRIDSWLNPYGDSGDTSYQLIQSIKAIGSGKMFGKGFGTSEVYVPVRESDMIFSTIGENFGFLGSCILIFIYFLLIYQMIRICFDTKNEFYAYIATGVIMMILFHVFENVGMSIGLLPLTGIPLPFISQGGTALLGNMMGVGLIMSMRYHYRSYMFSEEDEDFK